MQFHLGLAIMTEFCKYCSGGLAIIQRWPFWDDAARWPDIWAGHHQWRQ